MTGEYVIKEEHVVIEDDVHAILVLKKKLVRSIGILVQNMT